MSKRILFLAERMAMGFGVSVVVENLTEQLRKRGHHVEVGCLHREQKSERTYQVHMVDGSAESVHKLALEVSADYVIAHTSPFFELLAQLSGPYERWVWEHGDPTPELFPFDGIARRRIAENKYINVYPKVDRVIAISEFIRDDIGWPAADVIYNGCDHLQPARPSARSDNKLRVGTLMRLGEGEAFYKGNELYLELVEYCLSHSDNIQFYLMGRGTKDDVRRFQDLGVITHLNASDDERAQYLSDLDVFVSLSLWEGFNLPLVEAMVSGTFALAFDTGAHPEVTPAVVSSLGEMAGVILSLNANRPVLMARSQAMGRYVLERYRWSMSVESLLGLMSGTN